MDIKSERREACLKMFKSEMQETYDCAIKTATVLFGHYCVKDKLTPKKFAKKHLPEFFRDNLLKVVDSHDLCNTLDRSLFPMPNGDLIDISADLFCCYLSVINLNTLIKNLEESGTLNMDELIMVTNKNVHNKVLALVEENFPDNELQKKVFEATVKLMEVKSDGLVMVQDMYGTQIF